MTAQSSNARVDGAAFAVTEKVQSDGSGEPMQHEAGSRLLNEEVVVGGVVNTGSVWSCALRAMAWRAQGGARVRGVGEADNAPDVQRDRSASGSSEADSTAARAAASAASALPTSSANRCNEDRGPQTL
jgi:hypothetical protein